jgi:hypothetical protein
MSFKREYDESQDLYRCTQCGEWKDSASFYKNTQYKYGIMSKCKTCHNQYHKNKYRADRMTIQTVREEQRAAYRPSGPPIYDVTDEELDALTGDHTQL